MLNSTATSTPCESTSNSVNDQGKNVCSCECAGSDGDVKLAKAVMGQIVGGGDVVSKGASCED
jgi:hypothetical protein